MKRSLVLFITILAGSILPANGQDRPWNVEMNLSGVFLKTFANSLANSEVDDLSVDKWIVPGVSVSYDISKRVTVAYAFQPSRDLTLIEPYGFGATPDGTLTVDHATGSMHDLEVRLTPIRRGPYVSVALSHTTGPEYAMTFIRTGSTLSIGDDTYATDLESDWTFRTLTTAAIGLGYHMNVSDRLTGRLGMSVPIAPGSNHEDISVTTVNEAVPLDAQARARVESQLEDETFYLPVRIVLSVGWRF